MKKAAIPPLRVLSIAAAGDRIHPVPEGYGMPARKIAGLPK